jgi:hypothetical protein
MCFGSAHIGVFGGQSTFKFTGSDVHGCKTKTGFTGGLYVDCPMAQGVMFRPGLSYTVKGGSFTYVVENWNWWEGETGTYTVNEDFELNYVEMPLLLVFIPEYGKVKPSLLAGFTVGAVLDNRPVDPDDPDAYYAQEILRKLDPIDTAITIGAGVEIMHVNIEYRMNYGQRGLSFHYPKAKIYNHNSQLTFGFRF